MSTGQQGVPQHEPADPPIVELVTDEDIAAVRAAEAGAAGQPSEAVLRSMLETYAARLLGRLRP